MLFLTFSLFTVASILYLPDHIVTISRRAYYYFAGDGDNHLVDTAASQLGDTASKASEAVLDAATELAEAAYQASANTVAAAKDAAKEAAENLGWT